MVHTLTGSMKLNRPHIFYKTVYAEIISIIFLPQIKCLITGHHNIHCNILIVHQKDILLGSTFRFCFHIMLQELLIHVHHFLSEQKKRRGPHFYDSRLTCSQYSILFFHSVLPSFLVIFQSDQPVALEYTFLENIYLFFLIGLCLLQNLIDFIHIKTFLLAHPFQTIYL